MKIKKRAFDALFLIFFLLLLSGCASTERRWELTTNQGTQSLYCSSKLSLPSQDPFSGLSIEILTTPQGQAIYVNALGLTLQPDGQTAEGYPTIDVTIAVDNQSYQFKGVLLQGGHRIFLTDHASALLIESLQNQKTLDIQVAHCSSRIILDDFAKHYETANKTR